MGGQLRRTAKTRYGKDNAGEVVVDFSSIGGGGGRRDENSVIPLIVSIFPAETYRSIVFVAQRKKVVALRTRRLLLTKTKIRLSSCFDVRLNPSKDSRCYLLTMQVEVNERYTSDLRAPTTRF